MARYFPSEGPKSISFSNRELFFQMWGTTPKELAYPMFLTYPEHERIFKPIFGYKAFPTAN